MVPPAPTCMVPVEIVVPPVYVFAPVRMSVPAPVLVNKPAVPFEFSIKELIVNEVALATLMVRPVL